MSWIRFEGLRQASIDAITASLGEGEFRRAYEQGHALNFEAIFELSLESGGSEAVVLPEIGLSNVAARST
jgi:hypothetical protein